MTDDGAMFALAALAAIALGSEVAKRTGLTGSRALSQAERDALPASAFAIPSQRTYPIPDWQYGRTALTYAMWPNNEADRQKVKKAVFARYPSLIGWWNATGWVRDHPGESYVAPSRVATVDLGAIVREVA